MANKKFDDLTKGEIRGFLSRGVTRSVIQKHFKARNLSISQETIRRCEAGKEKPKKKEGTHKKPGPKRVLKKYSQTHIKKLMLSPNPPLQSKVAKRYKVDQKTISNTIKRSGLKK